jgi:hypothetical protein
MAGQACPPLVRVRAALPAQALLARCRATARSASASACEHVGLDALNVASQGALAPWAPFPVVLSPGETCSGPTVPCPCPYPGPTGPWGLARGHRRSGDECV